MAADRCRWSRGGKKNDASRKKFTPSSYLFDVGDLYRSSSGAIGARDEPSGAPPQERRMMSPQSGCWQSVSAKYLRTADAAVCLGIGKSTLERKRVEGGGPQFRVLGTRMIVYSVYDLAWASLEVWGSTSKKAAA